MDAFQHEAGLLREVEEGLRLRLSGHDDWGIFLRSGMPTEALANDPRFTAWSHACEALDALGTHAAALAQSRKLDGAAAAPDATATPETTGGEAPATINLPVQAAPRRALAQQVAAVTIKPKSHDDSPASTTAQDIAANMTPAEPVALPDPVAAQLLAISDDLTQIRGINAKTAEELNAAGIYRFAQIAAWSADDVKRMRLTLTAGGRLSRENWIEQAALKALDRKSQIVPAAARAEIAAGPAKALARETTDGPVAPSGQMSDAGETIAETMQPVRRARRLPLPRFERAASSVGIEHGESGAADDPAPQAEAPPKPAGDDQPKREAITDLTAIRGVSRETARKLRALGITETAQIADWSASDIGDFQVALGPATNIRRQNWTAQAAMLAAGIVTAHEAKRRAGLMRALTPAPREMPWPPRLVDLMFDRDDLAARALEDADGTPRADVAESDVRIVRRPATANRDPAPREAAAPPSAGAQKAADVRPARPPEPPPLPPELAVPTPSLPELLPFPEERGLERRGSQRKNRLPLPEPDAESLLDRDDPHADVMIVHRTPDGPADREDAQPASSTSETPQTDVDTQTETLSERLSARLTSVKPKRRSSRRPTLRQNYSLSPEEASVQIVRPAGREDAAHEDPADDDNTKEPSEDGSEARRRTKFMRALSGGRS